MKSLLTLKKTAKGCHLWNIYSGRQDRFISYFIEEEITFYFQYLQFLFQNFDFPNYHLRQVRLME